MHLKALQLRVGRNVRNARWRLGMTLQELATSTGVALRIVGELERGTGNPRLDTLHRVGKSLKLDPVELFAPESAPDVGVSAPKRGPKAAKKRAVR